MAGQRSLEAVSSRPIVPKFRFHSNTSVRVKRLFEPTVRGKYLGGQARRCVHIRLCRPTFTWTSLHPDQRGLRLIVVGATKTSHRAGEFYHRPSRMKGDQ